MSTQFEKSEEFGEGSIQDLSMRLNEQLCASFDAAFEGKRRDANTNETVSPNSAKLLLRVAVTQLRKTGTVSAAMSGHLIRCLELALNTNIDLDRAFGVKNARRGRPRNSEKDDLGLAIEILRLNLGGLSVSESVERIAEKLHKSSRNLERIWRAYKRDAITILRLERHELSEGWAEFEKNLLRSYAPDINL